MESDRFLIVINPVSRKVTVKWAALFDAILRIPQVFFQFMEWLFIMAAIKFIEIKSGLEAMNVLFIVSMIMITAHFSIIISRIDVIASKRWHVWVGLIIVAISVFVAWSFSSVAIYLAELFSSYQL